MFNRILIALICLIGCTNEEAAMKALLDAGYTQVELTGYAPRACGDDSTCTGFTAIGPTGRFVEGAVGCSHTGCGKGCTIRLQ